MTHAADPTPGQQLSDRAVSLIRTRVPILWGSLITALVTWLTPRLPGDLGASIGDWLSSEAVVAFVAAAIIYAWYWAWRRLEPRIPVWLVRLVLGSALTPTYAPVVDGAAQITSLPGPADLPAALTHQHTWVFHEHVGQGFRRYRCTGCGTLEIEPPDAHG